MSHVWITAWCPNGVLLGCVSLRNAVFQRSHRLANILGGSLDVIRCRGAHVRMSQDSLDYHVRHSKSIQVASESPTRRVPPVPFWDATITSVGMLRPVASLCLPAHFAVIQRRKNVANDYAAKRQGVA